MAVPAESINGPFVRGTFTKPPDYKRGTLSSSTTWAAISSARAYGRQARFDILSDGETDQGLRVSLLRAAAAAEVSNGYAVTLTLGSARSVTVTNTTKTIAIVVTASTTMAQLKTAIDANSNLGSAYFGGGGGTDATDAQEVADSAGGIEDQWAFVRIRCQGDLWIAMRTAVPTNLNNASMCKAEYPNDFMLPPGDQVYLRSRTGTVLSSIELWRGPVNG